MRTVITEKEKEKGKGKGKKGDEDMATTTTTSTSLQQNKAQRIINLAEKIATLHKSKITMKGDKDYIDLPELYSASKSLANTIEGLARQESVRTTTLQGIRIKDGKLLVSSSSSNKSRRKRSGRESKDY